MGLDTSHNCWHGPYSSFARWRAEIARVVGVPLSLMDGFYRDPPAGAMEWSEPRDGGPLCGDSNGPVLYHFISELASWLPLSWESLRPDVIHVLLNHSDCDGEIAVDDCIPLAKRLEEIAPMLPDDPKWHRGESARSKALQFAEGLRTAADAGDPVEFG